MASYSSLAEFKAWTDIEDTVDDAELQLVLDAVTRAIDRKCGRHFVLETAATKLYYPRSDGSLPVVDLISLTTLKTDSAGTRTYSTTLTAAQYELRPYVDEHGLPSVRYQEIHIWPNSSQAFVPGRLVQIVGNFGYVDTGSVTPTDIKQACLILAGRIWKRRETPLGILGATDLGQFERIGKFDPDVESLLEPYKRNSSSSWVLV